MCNVTETSKVIAVFGATGCQGRGVVAALLRKDSPAFHVLALTRNIRSEAARRLQDEHAGNHRLKFTCADVYNQESLYRALEGAYGVFAVTNTHIEGKKIQTEEDIKRELDAGQNIVAAAKACHVQHFVMSSLPNITEASGGRFSNVYHFDYKNEVEKLARQELNATFVHPGLFYTNLHRPQYCKREGDVVRFCPPVSGEKRADWVDPGHDIGIYVAEIFALGPDKTASKTYPVVGPKISFAEMAVIFKSITSQKSIYQPSTIEEWGDTVAAQAGVGYKRDIMEMMEWISAAPDEKVCYGTMDVGADTSFHDLGVKATSFEEWLERSNWTGP
ncbi:hypothetical protein EYZ11_006165 [Aspergillus tanneri]|uniref:NmrA-like domain-containing protein n=1 Tax=Aspergillus tanneri TaxID=1220188 RepID=A0A4S3JIG6_9EURO|nr:uncharacterized protein ATNIH1004_003984 [Aspergillus tanneri]KAA8648101.1 hypothetical protein ATNIH1004_003984 [Aspergillus tanneri]THC94367.1 hypothetical protein EYZ11_006165 [Aspergillus tanneri]